MLISIGMLFEMYKEGSGNSNSSDFKIAYMSTMIVIGFIIALPIIILILKFNEIDISGKFSIYTLLLLLIIIGLIYAIGFSIGHTKMP